MRILFDQGTPAPLRHALTGHTISTAYETAEFHFDALITTDRNLRYQQNVSGRKLAILVLPTTSWPKIQVHLRQVIGAVDDLHPGDFVELDFSEQHP
jgi:hypothetical protein